LEGHFSGGGQAYQAKSEFVLPSFLTRILASYPILKNNIAVFSLLIIIVLFCVLVWSWRRSDLDKFQGQWIGEGGGHPVLTIRRNKAYFGSSSESPMILDIIRIESRVDATELARVHFYNPNTQENADIYLYINFNYDSFDIISVSSTEDRTDKKIDFGPWRFRKTGEYH
jgi:hypothetical protein